MTNEIMEILKKAGYHVKCFNCNIVNNFWGGNSDIILKINDGLIDIENDITLPSNYDMCIYTDAINSYNLSCNSIVGDCYDEETQEEVIKLLKIDTKKCNFEELTIEELQDIFVESNISSDKTTELMLNCYDETITELFDDFQHDVTQNFIDTMCIYNYIKTHENLRYKDITFLISLGCIAFKYENHIYFRNYTNNENIEDYIQFMLFNSLPSDSFYFRDEKYFFEYFTEEQKKAFKAKILALNIEEVNMYKRGE